MRRCFAIIAVALFATALFAPAVYARPIEGVATVRHFGPVPQEHAERARAEAAGMFTEELKMWLRQEMRIDVDTTNTVKKLALRKLVERCLEEADIRTTTRGRTWTMTMTLSETAARGALRAHNDYFDRQAATLFQTARGNDLSEALPGAIGALGAAMTKLEPAGASTGVNVDDIRQNVQTMFDRIAVTVEGTVIEGRPGSAARQNPSAVFTIDGQPLTNFHMTAFAQHGRQLARMRTDAQGALPVANLRVPFVHNGSMLTISPDAREHMQAGEFIRFRDLGVRFNRGQELSFIYRVPALTYTLEFRVFSQDRTITIPGDFSGDAHVRNHLRQFCGMVPAAAGATPDLNIRIGAEISRHTYDETEEDGMRMTARAEFRGPGIERTGQHIFEMRQPLGTSFQTGAYFWEASSALRELIAKVLGEGEN
jgi:hypothetical protein